MSKKTPQLLKTACNVLIELPLPPWTLSLASSLRGVWLSLNLLDRRIMQDGTLYSLQPLSLLTGKGEIEDKILTVG